MHRRHFFGQKFRVMRGLDVRVYCVLDVTKNSEKPQSGAVIFLDKTFNIPLLLDARPEIDSQTKWTMATQLTHLSLSDV